MQNTYSWLALGVAVAVLLVGGAYVIQKRNTAAPSVSSATSTIPTASTTMQNLGNGVSVKLPAGATIETVDSAIPHPSLIQKIQIAATVAQDASTAIKTQETMYLEQLAKEPTRVDLWLKLGVIAKMAGDYQRAIDCWDYVAVAGSKPINSVAYGNLADIYLTFAVDLAKAKSAITKGLAIVPNDAHLLELKAVLESKQ